MSVEKTIEVDNLKCQGCAGTIIKKVSAMIGVEGVEVDVDSSAVTVRFDNTVLVDDIFAKLSSLGYPENGTTNSIQKAKSYVSCAIGKVGA
ncbi:MAG: heavy-metal-associated domain-containing protein [Reichenbachiella sp.]